MPGVLTTPAGATPDQVTAQDSTQAFSTPERMRQATPLDVLSVDRSEMRAAEPRRGKKTLIAPSAPGSSLGIRPAQSS